MADLISLDRALAQLPNIPNVDQGTVAVLISACSQAVENYCRRSFALDTYDELLHGTGTPYLEVTNPPISKVISVRTGLVPAVYVQNNDPTNLTQAATVDVTSSAVVLTRIYNATTTTTTLTFADYPTCGALVTAINGLGNNWLGTINGQFSLWETSDLNMAQGSFSARNMTVPLMVFWQSLPYFRVNEVQGEIWSGGGFVQGYQNYRVTYIGGFSPIPDPIQQAVAELVQIAYRIIQLNPLTQSETLDKYSYTRMVPTNWWNLMSPTAKMGLDAYKLMRVARYK